MTVLVRPEILSSLNSVREDVQRQVAALDRYRVLKAIERTIADFPALDDVTRSLGDIRERVQQQLDETREYRALQTIERIVPELSQVFALLEEQAAPEPSGAPQEENAPEREDASAEDDGLAPHPRSAPEPDLVDESETVSFAETGELTAAPVGGEPFAGREDVVVRSVESGFEPGCDYRPPTVEAPLASGSPAVPSLADSVAQLMAQSNAPPQRESHAPQPAVQEDSDAMSPHAERAA